MNYKLYLWIVYYLILKKYSLLIYTSTAAIPFISFKYQTNDVSYRDSKNQMNSNFKITVKMKIHLDKSISIESFYIHMKIIIVCATNICFDSHTFSFIQVIGKKWPDLLLIRITYQMNRFHMQRVLTFPKKKKINIKSNWNFLMEKRKLCVECLYIYRSNGKYEFL